MHRTSPAAPRSPRSLAAVVLVLGAALAASAAARAAEPKALRIGVVGAGRIGGSLAALWVRAGHEVLVSSRRPRESSGRGCRI